MLPLGDCLAAFCAFVFIWRAYARFLIHPSTDSRVPIKPIEQNRAHWEPPRGRVKICRALAPRWKKSKQESLLLSLCLCERVSTRAHGKKSSSGLFVSRTAAHTHTHTLGSNNPQEEIAATATFLGHWFIFYPTAHLIQFFWRIFILRSICYWILKFLNETRLNHYQIKYKFLMKIINNKKNDFFGTKYYFCYFNYFSVCPIAQWNMAAPVAGTSWART